MYYDFINKNSFNNVIVENETSQLQKQQTSKMQ